MIPTQYLLPWFRLGCCFTGGFLWNCEFVMAGELAVRVSFIGFKGL